MVTDNEVFIAVTYKVGNQTKNDLFQSVSKQLKFSKFKSSLKNIIIKCGTERDFSVHKKIHTLDLNNNPCIEIRSLKTGYYLANAYNEANMIETFFKKSDSEWSPVSYHDSQDKKNFFLNLNDNFFQLFLNPPSIFSPGPSLPDYIVATADKDVYLSYGEGET